MLITKAPSLNPFNERLTEEVKWVLNCFNGGPLLIGIGNHYNSFVPFDMALVSGTKSVEHIVGKGDSCCLLKI